MTRYEALAKEFHDAYERLAPEFGYKTREASAVPWEDVPEQNKALMVATVEHVMAGAVDDVRDALRLGNIEGVEMTREEMARWSELMAKYPTPRGR